jgi:hypothetical protein
MVILLYDTDHVAASVAGDSGGHARTFADVSRSGMAASPWDYQKQ